MIGTLVVILIAAALAYPLCRAFKGAAWVLAVAPAWACYYFVTKLPFHGEHPLVENYQWIRVAELDLDIRLAFRLDGLSLLFAILITGIGTFIVVYAGGYMHKQEERGRLLAYLLAFMASMLGLVLSDDIILMFVFWELTSFTSFLLIGFKHELKSSRDAAMQALVVTAGGGLAMLAGLILLSMAAASMGATPAEATSISGWLKLAGDKDSLFDFRTHSLYLPAFLLILAGAVTKSAQFPFHFWLPSAMAAPTPVSAFLHSATMVKAGVFLLARMHPLLGGTDAWFYWVTGFGAVTMIATAIIAVTQTDMKRVLAYSTVSVLGTLTMLLGLGSEKCIEAAVIYLTAHALYKAALFMLAGNIDHAAGTRDLTILGGLARVMPVSAAAALVAGISQAGLPPMLGFIAKEIFYEAQWDYPNVGLAFLFVSIAASSFLVCVAMMAGVWPYWGKLKDTPQHPHEAPFSMLLGPLVLAALSIGLGFYAASYGEAIASAAASAIAGSEQHLHLALFHELKGKTLTMLGLSGVTFALGLLIYSIVAKKLAVAFDFMNRLEPMSAAACYDRLLAGLMAFAAGSTRVLQSGLLRRYMLIIFLVTFVLAGYPLVQSYGKWKLDLPAEAWTFEWDELMLAVLAVLGAFAAIVLKSRLSAVAALGVTGLGIAILFAIFGAPDLAITQIMVESLTVILFVFVFYHLPKPQVTRTNFERLHDGTIAIVGGALITMLVLAAGSVHSEPILNPYFAATSEPYAHGRNIVNVILVDYRGIDTMGEITVVAVAGLGVLALLSMGRRWRREGKV